MNSRRNCFISLLPDRIAPLVAQSACHVDISDHALPQLLHRFAQSHRRAAVRAMLTYLVIFARGLDQLAPLPVGVRTGLFDVDVLARLHGPDSHQTVPVIWRRDRDRVDRLVFEQLANVRELGRPLALGLFDLVQTLPEHRFINIAQSGDLDVLHLRIGANVRVSLSADSDACHADRVVRTVGQAFQIEAQRPDGRGAGRRLYELSSIFHFSAPRI